MPILLEPAQIRAFLLDVEGTTTPVDFVYKVLFPFARTHVRGFLEQQGSSEEVRKDIEALRADHLADQGNNLNPPSWRSNTREAEFDSVVAYVDWLMDRDRKSTSLKALQGRIWQDGYRSGALRSEVYADVPRAFARWRQHGKDVSIFSSGSVLAQKLLFAHTDAGDLTPHIHSYFDTNVGPKVQAASYLRITEVLRIPPPAVVFVSDVVAELDAAQQAGIHPVLCLRPGAAQPSAHGYPVIQTFDELP